MNTYTETKKQLDAIRNKYSCAGDIILKTALQALIESGAEQFMDDNWFKVAMRSVDIRHDKAEAEGKCLFMTRDFEKAIYECARELAQVNTYNLLTYIQQEVWLDGSEVGKPDYQRAIQLIKNFMNVIEDKHYERMYTLEDFYEVGLRDHEIEYFGYDYLLDDDDNAEDEED